MNREHWTIKTSQSRKLRLTQPREKQPPSSLVKFFKGEIPENHPASHSWDSQEWPLLLSKLPREFLEDYNESNIVSKDYSQIILSKMGLAPMAASQSPSSPGSWFVKPTTTISQIWHGFMFMFMSMIWFGNQSKSIQSRNRSFNNLNIFYIHKYVRDCSDQT